MNVMSGYPPRKKIRLKKCFTIDSESRITVHSSRKVARETGRVFATEVEFADLVGPDSERLVENWSGLPGVKPVVKSTHQKIASERTEAQPIPEGTPPQPQGESAASSLADQPGGPATTAGGAKGHRSPVLPAKGNDLAFRAPRGDEWDVRASAAKEDHIGKMLYD